MFNVAKLYPLALEVADPVPRNSMAGFFLILVVFLGHVRVPCDLKGVESIK